MTSCITYHLPLPICHHRFPIALSSFCASFFSPVLLNHLCRPSFRLFARADSCVCVCGCMCLHLYALRSQCCRARMMLMHKQRALTGSELGLPLLVFASAPYKRVSSISSSFLFGNLDYEDTETPSFPHCRTT